MRTVAIIPARAGSKSIVDKNLQLVRGHSLIGWAVAAAKSTQCSEVFIDTDSPEYAAEGERYGAIAPFLRRKKFATDTSSDTESFSEFTSRIGLEASTVVVHLRPTTPLRSWSLVERAIESFRESIGTLTALRSVHEMAESAFKSFELSPDNLLQPLGGLVNSVETANLPRQAFPKTYSANGYVDIFKAGNLQTTSKLHGDTVRGFLTPQTHEVDSQHELSIIRMLAMARDYDEFVSRMDGTIANV